MVNRIVGNSLSCIQDRTNPTLGQFIFVCLVHLQMSWTSFSKPSSSGSRVGLAPVVKIYNKKMLEPVLSHLTAFLAYLEDRGSHFSWCCLKKPVLEFLARSANNKSNQCIPPHGVSKEISFKMSAFITSMLVRSTKLRPLSASQQAWNPTKP